MADSRYSVIGSPEVRLIEECSEVIKAVTKAMRFGMDDWHPDDASRTKNRTLIANEMGDLVRSYNELAQREGMRLLRWEALI